MQIAATVTRLREPGRFWRTDDAWALTAGLGLVLAGLLLFAGGAGAPAWIAVVPPPWHTVAELAHHFATAWPRYAAQFLLWLGVVTGCLAALGQAPRRVVPAFVFLYVASIGILSVGQWAEAVRYNLEPPLLALAFGLVVANTGLLRQTAPAAFRVEFFIKLGVVLLGATLPLSLLVWAGPIALVQASIVSIVTFGVIFAAARALGIDSRFAATLGVGGAVCGVSAAIAVAAAVGGRRQDTGVVISIVILWAIVMIFALPFAAAALHMPAGVGGAWIGTSEFADAAGLAAAQSYGALAAHLPGAPPGEAERAVAAFTLMKVVGRDVWIGIWALVLSIVAASRWDDIGIVNRVGPGEIWRRFPKFVFGFFVASLLLTLLSARIGHAAFTHDATPRLVAPIKNLRTEAFAFGFLAIGLTTRMRDLAGIGGRPFAAFSVGVAVNLVLGLVLSAVVFGSAWAGLGR